MAVQTIRITKKAGNQIIEIPENFNFNDDKVILKKIGNALYIIPFHNPWQTLMNSLDKFTPDFMDKRKQPLLQKRKKLD